MLGVILPVSSLLALERHAALRPENACGQLLHVRLARLQSLRLQLGLANVPRRNVLPASGQNIRRASAIVDAVELRVFQDQVISDWSQIVFASLESGLLFLELLAGELFLFLFPFLVKQGDGAAHHQQDPAQAVADDLAR